MSVTDVNPARLWNTLYRVHTTMTDKEASRDDMNVQMLSKISEMKKIQRLIAEQRRCSITDTGLGITDTGGVKRQKRTSTY